MPRTKESKTTTKSKVVESSEKPTKITQKVTADTPNKVLFKKSLREGLFFAVIIVVFNLLFVSKVEFGSLTLAQKIILILSSYVVAVIIMTVIGFLFAYAERAVLRKKAKLHVQEK